MFEKEAEEYLKKDGTKAEQILDMLNKISPLKITLKQVPFILAMIQQVFKDGAKFGYNKANEWHNLQENPTDLPKCEENEQIIFYVKEWIESIQKYRNHYCLGVYKKSFLIEGVKVFAEKSKGYENEHLPITVLRWRELEKWESE